MSTSIPARVKPLEGLALLEGVTEAESTRTSRSKARSAQELSEGHCA